MMHRKTERGLLALLLVWMGAACTGAPPRARDATSAAMVSPRALFEHGRALARAGDPLRGEQYMVLAVHRGFPERAAITHVIEACLTSARLRAALGHALPFLRRNPTAWRLRQLAGALQLTLGDAVGARAQLQRVVRQRPDAAESHYLLAVIASEHLHDADVARERYRAYLRLRPRGIHAAEARAWLEVPR